jgi:hypothetical protein
MSTRVLRIGLVALALPQVAIGLWGLLAPRTFYDDFPGTGHAWVSVLGPYDEHLLRDATAGFLALGVLLGWAAIAPSPVLVRAALGAWLVFAVPHLIFHATHTGGLSTADNIADLTGLAFEVVLPVVLLVGTRRTVWRVRAGEVRLGAATTAHGGTGDGAD